MKTSASIGSRSATEKKPLRRESGTTLIETMIAASVLLIGVLGLVGTLAVAESKNWNRGDRATRATEYAEDKMEQLLSLSFTDTTTDTTVYPPAITGGTGLTVGGGIVVGSPVTGYVDYVNDNGSQQTSSTTASFVRQWSVSVNAGGNLDTITVKVSPVDTIDLNSAGAAPAITLVCTKSAIQ